MEENRSKPSRTLRIILGLVLILPSAGCCALTLLLPAIQTVNFSLQQWTMITPARYIGLQNYQTLLSDPLFFQALSNTLLLAGERLLAALLAPLLLALAASWIGDKMAMVVRLLTSFPLAFALPTLSAMGWQAALQASSAGRISWISNFITPQWLRTASSARWVLLAIDFSTTLAIACGLGLIIFLAVLRRDEPSARFPLRALLGVWVAGLLGIVAWSLPEFTQTLVLTRGGPTNATINLGYMTYAQAFQLVRFGYAAALQTLILLASMLLGLAATLWLILLGVRLEFGDKQGGTGQSGPLRLVGVALLGLLFLSGAGIFTWSMAPLAASLQLSSAPDLLVRLSQQVPLGSASVNSLLPALIPLLFIQLPLTYLAALGIGGLRPLGRFSEWLLMLFAPWLFVSPFLLVLPLFTLARDLKLISNPLLLYIPTLNVPILLILTFFFKGQASRWETGVSSGPPGCKSYLTQMVLPSLPLTVLLGCLSLAARLQDISLPLVLISQRQMWPLGLWALSFSGLATFPNPGTILVSLVWLGLGLAGLVILILFHLFFLNRLTVKAGQPS